jgi:hypothetical protein
LGLEASEINHVLRSEFIEELAYQPNL